MSLTLTGFKLPPPPYRKEQEEQGKGYSNIFLAEIEVRETHSRN